MEWEDTSIARADGMDERAMLSAIDAGARVVVFELVASLALNYYTSRRRHLVLPGETPQWVGLRATSATALLGWWGVGLLQTPVSMYRNLTGGVDVTDEVRLELETRLTEKVQRAEAQAEVEASLTAETTARRVRALASLDRGDVEEAWALVGDDASRERGSLTRDLPLLRRLLTALHDRRLWTRAARVAQALERDFPYEVRGYTETMVRRVEARSNDPDGAAPRQPWWAIPLLILLGLGGAAAMVLEIRKAWR